MREWNDFRIHQTKQQIFKINFLDQINRNTFEQDYTTIQQIITLILINFVYFKKNGVDLRNATKTRQLFIIVFKHRKRRDNERPTIKRWRQT
jgi:hypothetical protein